MIGVTKKIVWLAVVAAFLAFAPVAYSQCGLGNTPAAPTTPINGVSVPTGPVDFSWRAAGNVTRPTYDVVFHQLPTGRDTLACSSTSLTCTSTQSFAPGDYEWVVVTKSGTATCSTSAIGQFRVAAACPTILINPDTLPDGVVGTEYAAATSGITFAQKGGAIPITWSVVEGTKFLPPGLTLEGNRLSGTPSNDGGYTFTIRATDANGCFAEQRYTVTMTCPAMLLGPSALQNGTIAQRYGPINFVTKGGTAPHTYSVITGTLPAGLTLTGSTLDGNLTAAGTSSFTIQSRDSFGCLTSRAYTLQVCPDITVSPGFLPAGTVGTNYSATITAGGGTSPYTFALTLGALPPGLTLTGGTISGSPTATGTFDFVITATDVSGCSRGNGYRIVVCPQITVGPAALGDGTAGTSYSATFTATGGTAPYTFAVTAGSLPSGLSLSGATLSGTPTVVGASKFIITATDANGCTGRATYDINVVEGCPTIRISPSTLPDATVRVAYSVTLTATGGTAPHDFTLFRSVLPSGLILAGNVISGTPDTLGTFNFTIQVTDARRCVGVQDFSLIVAEPVCGTGITTLITPANAAIIPPEVSFSWSAVKGSAGFDVMLSADGGVSFTTIASTIGTTAKAILKEGKYVWFVRTNFGGTCRSTDSGPSTFAVELAPVCPSNSPALVSPADLASVPAGNVNLTWTAVTNATSYDVFIGLDGAIPTLQGTTSSTSMSRLLDGGKSVEWYVVAKATNCRSLESAHFRFTTQESRACPTTPADLVSPIRTNVPVGDITLKWNPSPNATTYEVFVGLAGKLPVGIGSTSSTSMIVTIKEATSVEWFVRAGAPVCKPLDSLHAAFNTVDPCANGSPTPFAPAEGASVPPQTTFAWNGVLNATGYKVFILQPRSILPTLVGTTPSTRLTVSSLPVGPLVWFVQAMFDGCPVTESARTNFTVVAESGCPTDAPGLVSPANGARVINPFLFDWNPVKGATNYRLVVAIDGGTPTPIVTTADTSYETKLPGKSADWYVEALFDSCPATQSERFKFFLGEDGVCPTNVPAPQLTSPPQNATDVGSPVRFTFIGSPGAISHTVHASVNGAAFVPLGTTTDTTFVADLPSGKVLWQVEANFKGCPSVISSRGAFAITAGSGCVGTATTLQFPGNDAQVSPDTVLQWAAVKGAVGYDVFVAFNGSTRFELLGSSITNALEKTLPSGDVQWFVNTKFAGCPDQKSAIGRFTVVSSSLRACAGSGAISLREPANGAALSGLIRFSWTSTVANVAGYRVWAAANGDAFEVVAKTTTETTATAAVGSGDIEWYVEAVLTCASILSPHGKFTVQKANTCDSNQPVTLISPVGSESSPAQVSTRVSFLFNPAQGASSYKVWLRNNANRAFEDIATVPALGFPNSNSTVTRDLPAGDFTWYVETIYPSCPPVESVRSFFRIAATEAACKNDAPATIAPSDGAVVVAPVTFLFSSVEKAVEYRLYLGNDGADPAVIETTSATSVTKSLPPGKMVWFVEAIFKSCPSTRSEKSQFTITRAAVCTSDTAQPLLPADGVSVPSTKVDFGWNAVSGSVNYVLFARSGDDAATSLGETTETNLTRTVPAGARIEWWVVTFFAGCPPTESQHFSFTTSPACDNRRAVLLSPEEGAFNLPSGNVFFSWTPVPLAVSYNLLVATGPDDFQLLGSGPQTQRTLELPSGPAKWFVQAVFDNCPVTESAVARFTVAAPPPVCGIPDKVQATVAGQVLSGTIYNLRWNGVNNAGSYEVQEATKPDFSDATTHIVDGVVATLSHDVSGAATQYRYRVRAISNCSDQRGVYSDEVTIFVTPVLQTNGGAEIGFNDNVVQTLVLPGGPAPLNFTATVDKPWLTVTPSSGQVPAAPDSLTLTVTADPNFLYLGTNSGTVTVIYSDVTSSRRFETNATPAPTKSTVSVSLVTPVGSGGKNSPPPESLIIPAVAHLAGANNSAFESDVRLANLSAQTMKYQINFTPTQTDATTKGSSTVVQVEPGATMALDDVLETFFGTGGAFALGSVEIRPLTSSSSSIGTSAAAARTTIASSRTFNVTPNGTFGQFIPALPYSSFVGRATGSIKNVLSLQQIAQSDSFRTNFGLLEASGEPADVMIRVFNNSGDLLAEIPDKLKAGEHKQGNILASNNIALEDGRIEVEVMSSTGRVTAYASTLDNKTNDPLLISPVLKNSVSSKRYVLPGVALLNTGFADFRTDARIFNAGASPTRATVTYYPQVPSETTQARELQFAPGEVKALDNVLANLFGLAATGGGLIAITTESNSNIVSTARTYNQTTNGTFGQFVPGITPDESAAVGGRVLNLLQLEQSSRFRSNIGIAETSGQPAKVEVSVYLPDSKVIPRTQFDVGANGFSQRSLQQMFGLNDVYNARVVVKVISGPGKITAYASVIDQITQDPTYVPAQ